MFTFVGNILYRSIFDVIYLFIINYIQKYDNPLKWQSGDKIKRIFQKDHNKNYNQKNSPRILSIPGL